MSYKSSNKNLSFSDLELSQTKAKNITLQYLNKLDEQIDWIKIESILLKNYSIGKKKKGPQAYSPLMLFKCLLLRNWFQIKSDSELESMINDRVSFKIFAGLPMGDTAPDSSTFSRFRNRMTHLKYESVLSDLSDQLSDKNIIISMGSVQDIKIMIK